MRRWNRTKHRLIRGMIILFFVAVLLGVIVTFLVESYLRPIFIAIAEEKAMQLASVAINDAVYQHAQNLKYTDLIHYQTNHQGDIILMQPNLSMVNNFITQVNKSIQEKMLQLSEKKIKIPVAQALGVQVLASLGPKMTVHMTPIGLVRPSQIEDSFESAGINQTRHKIYMDITVEILVIVPFVRERIQVHSQVPVTEVTILGKVPEVYLGLEGGSIEQLIKRGEK